MTVAAKHKPRYVFAWSNIRILDLNSTVGKDIYVICVLVLSCVGIRFVTAWSLFQRVKPTDYKR
jgi:hypothetical protein